MALNRALMAVTVSSFLLCSAGLAQAQAPGPEDRTVTKDVIIPVDSDRHFDWGWIGLLGLLGLGGLSGRSRSDYTVKTTRTPGAPDRV
jgi:hypothetical protein